MQEFFLTIQRQLSSARMEAFENQPGREYWTLLYVGEGSVTEELMVMQRRMMVGGMRDPTATVVTIVVTGLEEAFVRCTMVYRDELWDWIISRPEPDEAKLRTKRLVQSANAANGMRIEVTSIITTR